MYKVTLFLGEWCLVGTEGVHDDGGVSYAHSSGGEYGLFRPGNRDLDSRGYGNLLGACVRAARQCHHVWDFRVPHINNTYHHELVAKHALRCVCAGQLRQWRVQLLDGSHHLPYGVFARFDITLYGEF